MIMAQRPKLILFFFKPNILYQEIQILTGVLRKFHSYPHVNKIISFLLLNYFAVNVYPNNNVLLQ